MSPFAQTSFAGNVSRPFRVRSIPVWISSNLTHVNMATFALLLMCCLAYIIQVNGTASKGYQIRDLENAIQQLTVANEQFELEIQQAQSLGNIRRAVKMIGMVPAEQAVYVDVRSESVAFAK